MFKPVPRKPQQSRVYLVAIQTADIALQSLIPCTRFNLDANAIPLARKPISGHFFDHTLLVQCQQSVEGCPAHQTRMCVVYTRAPRLPDTRIRSIPIPGNVLSKTSQRFLHTAIKAVPVLSKLRRRLDDFAVNIQLELLAGCVSDPDRTRTAIPVQ